MKYIVTGIKGGLGKFLHENVPNSLGIDRNNLTSILSQIEPDDIIIHCAFNKTNNITNYYSYLEDTIFLTKQLLELGNRIIYISSVDVYMQDNTYSMFKKFGESIIRKNNNNLIIRCPLFLGKYMKTNHLTKLRDGAQILTLHGNSSFNYITYEDVFKFITTTSLKGVCDLISKDNVELNTIKQLFNAKTVLGDYKYETTNQFDNPIYTGRTSLETVKNYFKLIKDTYEN